MVNAPKSGSQAALAETVVHPVEIRVGSMIPGMSILPSTMLATGFHLLLETNPIRHTSKLIFGSVRPYTLTSNRQQVMELPNIGITNRTPTYLPVITPRSMLQVRPLWGTQIFYRNSVELTF